MRRDEEKVAQVALNTGTWVAAHRQRFVMTWNCTTTTARGVSVLNFTCGGQTVRKGTLTSENYLQNAPFRKIHHPRTLGIRSLNHSAPLDNCISLNHSVSGISSVTVHDSHCTPASFGSLYLIESLYATVSLYLTASLYLIGSRYFIVADVQWNLSALYLIGSRYLIVTGVQWNLSGLGVVSKACCAEREICQCKSAVPQLHNLSSAFSVCHFGIHGNRKPNVGTYPNRPSLITLGHFCSNISGGRCMWY